MARLVPGTGGVKSGQQNSNLVQRQPVVYSVTRYDNGHFADSAEAPDPVGRYDTAEDALAAAKTVVDESLRHLAAQSSSVDDLLDKYSDWGDSVSIRGHPRVDFGSWDYAKERAEAIFVEVNPEPGEDTALPASKG
jgi:hypothetical protein